MVCDLQCQVYNLSAVASSSLWSYLSKARATEKEVAGRTTHIQIGVIFSINIATAYVCTRHFQENSQTRSQEPVDTLMHMLGDSFRSSSACSEAGSISVQLVNSCHSVSALLIHNKYKCVEFAGLLLPCLWCNHSQTCNLITCAKRWKKWCDKRSQSLRQHWENHMWHAMWFLFFYLLIYTVSVCVWLLFNHIVKAIITLLFLSCINI